MPQYSITIEGYDKLKTAFKNTPMTAVPLLKNAIQTSVNIIRPIMVKNAPFKSGKLRQNIFARVSDMTGTVGPDLIATPYAMYVHQGTKAYTIYPKTKKALYWKGALHPVRQVNHPGIKSNPFVERTVVEVRQPIQLIFKNTLNQITKFMSK